MFLSYARSTEEQASYVERALRESGYVVWRDTELPAHLSYADVIEERLKSAKAVLVLWSAEAAKSQWVRAEADAARELGTLIQSSVDGTVPPIPFNQIQCADLSGWTGDNEHSGWRKLKSSVVALAGQAEESPKAAARKRPTSSICVLPFQNLSANDVPDYFSDGLSEDIISDLAKTRALSVVPRKTAFKFRGPDVDASDVALELAVGYVLEGSVRKAGNRVRITAQLVDGATGEYAWSERYTRDFADIFSIQDEIVQAIVDALKAKLVPVEKKGADGAKGGDADAVKTPAPAPPAEAEEPLSAFQFAAPNAAVAEQKPEAKAAPAPAPAAEPVAVEPPAPEPPYVEEQAEVYEELNSGETWDEGGDWDDDEDWRKKSFLSLQLPRLIGLAGVVLLMALAAFAFWPDRSVPVVEEPEQEIAYTIIDSVYVRSLPTRKGSRVLGELKVGDTINIVPALAGAQPDWLKIKDGPYVGGYVWRESTKPVLEDEGAGGGDGTASGSGTGRDVRTASN